MYLKPVLRASFSGETQGPCDVEVLAEIEVAETARWR